MTKQEYIKNMAYSICNISLVGEPKNCNECVHELNCVKDGYAEAFYNAGYRKATEVIDEFVERLKNQFDSNGNLNTAMFGWTTSEIKMLIDLSSKDFINELAAECGRRWKR